MTNLKWPTKLVIVRHGESEQNVAIDLMDQNPNEKNPRLVRDADIQLTKKGMWQAQKTGIYLSKYPKFDICFSSPYKRALQTSKYLVSKLGYKLKIYEDNRLREKEFGKFDGISVNEIRMKYPEECADREREGKYWYRPPRGENYPDVETRVHSFLDKLARDYGGKNVLIVTHQIPYKMFRALFEHLNEKGVLSLGNTPNCGIEEFNIDTSKVPEGRLKLVKYDEKVY